MKILFLLHAEMPDMFHNLTLLAFFFLFLFFAFADFFLGCCGGPDSSQPWKAGVQSAGGGAWHPLSSLWPFLSRRSHETGGQLARSGAGLQDPVINQLTCRETDWVDVRSVFTPRLIGLIKEEGFFVSC